MSDVHLNVLSAGMAWAGCYLVLCRIDKMMKGVTQPSVFLQHAFLGVCMFIGGGLQLIPDGRPVAMGVVSLGVVVFFVVSRRRWRTQAPKGTEKPGVASPPVPIETSKLQQVHGGKG